jgi:K+-transporting ATPase KdpF subunit
MLLSLRIKFGMTRGSGVVTEMDFILAGVIAFGLFVYLLYAMFHPEQF